MKKIVFVLYALILATFLNAQNPQERLEQSPRHQEWVDLEHGDRTLEAFLVFPEVDEKAIGVIVIHENRGLNDWARSMVDQLAEKGYIAIAPDLLSGAGPQGGKTSDFSSSDAAREALYQLDPDQVTADLNAAFHYLNQLPACNGKIVVIGFCWGGSQAFRYATNQPDIEAALVFYGTAPKSGAGMEDIQAPVYGFYGGNDERVNATLKATEEQMSGAGKTFDPVIYQGAGHGFMRSGEGPNASAENSKARVQAWNRLVSILIEL